MIIVRLIAIPAKEHVILARYVIQAVSIVTSAMISQTNVNHVIVVRQIMAVIIVTLANLALNALNVNQFVTQVAMYVIAVNMIK